MKLLRHGDAVEVIFADEHDREMPYRREVERFVERTLIGRSVAEEADADLIGLAHLDRKPHTSAQAMTRAYNTVCAKDAEIQIGDVHRTAAALAVAALLGVELGHHALEVTALGDHMTVAAVRARDIVILAQAGAGGGRNRFFTDVQGAEAGDFGFGVKLVDLRFKLAYPLHGQIHFLELFILDRHNILLICG